MFVNYDKLMEKEISLLKKQTVKPKLLLHTCCAPCFSGCIHRIKDVFDLTSFFYNPNMDGCTEYFRRAEEMTKLGEILGVKTIIEEYDSEPFFEAVKGLEQCFEGGERCFKCFELRLLKTAEKAKAMGFDYFATTLTLSPLKNVEKLNEIGNKVSEQVGVKYLPSDFKKKDGYKISLEMSREHDLYRQNYCGCVFSKNKNPNN